MNTPYSSKGTGDINTPPNKESIGEQITRLEQRVTELEQELTEMTRQRDDYKGNLALIDAELHKRNGECAELRAEVERLKKALKAISDEFDFLGREEPAYLRNIAVQALKLGGDQR